MTKFVVRIKKIAKKGLEKIPSKIRSKIEDRIEELQDNPFAGEKMQGFEDRYKFRQGGYRVIYEIYEEIVTIEVIKIGPRGDVYKD